MLNTFKRLPSDPGSGDGVCIFFGRPCRATTRIGDHTLYILGSDTGKYIRYGLSGHAEMVIEKHLPLPAPRLVMLASLIEQYWEKCDKDDDDAAFPMVRAAHLTLEGLHVALSK